MDVNQFLSELDTRLGALDFVDYVEIEQRSNAVRRTQSFSIILENTRKWGFDFDNRVGWHEHPIDNPNLHVSSKSKTIPEIIEKLTKAWNRVS